MKQQSTKQQDTKENLTIFKVRVTGEVLATAAGTRQHQVNGRVLTFGREPIYLRAGELPQALTSDPYLMIDPVESTPPDVPVIDLRPERVAEG